MKDGNTGEYMGAVYTAVDGTPLQCQGCAGKRPDGSVNLEFCNAMPDCMASDRSDKRGVVFIQKGQHS